MPRLAALLSALLAGAASAGAPPVTAPSRPAEKGCVWKKLTDPSGALEVWAEPCDFGFRKISLGFAHGALVTRYSDGGGPYAVVEILDLLPGESVRAGIRRIFATRTEKSVASRCVLAPYRGDKARPKVERYTFVPDAAYAKQLEAKGNPDEVPEPPCGEWGEMPDGIQYFEAQPATGSRKVLFVRVGQDEPLFDENTLRLLPPR